MFRYELCGVAVACDTPLQAQQIEEGPATLRVHHVGGLFQVATWPLLVEVQPPGTPHPFMTIHRQGDDYGIVVPLFGTFKISGADISYSATCDNRELGQLLCDQIIPRVLQLHGHTSLHASAVALPDAAGTEGIVAFVGPSGSGKSTLAAALAARHGATFFADDCLTLSFEDVVFGHRSYPSARLRKDTAELLTPPERQSIASTRSRKLRVTFDPSPTSRAPLRKVYALTRGPTAEAADLSTAAGMAELTRQLHRLDPKDPALLASEFEALTHLSRAVPVATLRYPHTLAGIDAVHALIRA